MLRTVVTLFLLATAALADPASIAGVAPGDTSAEVERKLGRAPKVTPVAWIYPRLEVVFDPDGNVLEVIGPELRGEEPANQQALDRLPQGFRLSGLSLSARACWEAALRDATPANLTSLTVEPARSELVLTLARRFGPYYEAESLIRMADWGLHDSAQMYAEAARILGGHPRADYARSRQSELARWPLPRVAAVVPAYASEQVHDSRPEIFDALLEQPRSQWTPWLKSRGNPEFSRWVRERLDWHLASQQYPGDGLILADVLASLEEPVPDLAPLTQPAVAGVLRDRRNRPLSFLRLKTTPNSVLLLDGEERMADNLGKVIALVRRGRHVLTTSSGETRAFEVEGPFDFQEFPEPQLGWSAQGAAVPVDNQCPVSLADPLLLGLCVFEDVPLTLGCRPSTPQTWPSSLQTSLTNRADKAVTKVELEVLVVASQDSVSSSGVTRHQAPVRF